ncbi:ABC transporter permease [Ancylobacter sp. MQZ15Z-1]|uniref:ABC transporter permease n=1 Tax=Ancylobacter mangrovi TaxID=2972472 RepID=A0A9X2PGJ5_9HYPH|nr:ABC transporter permease [Ancylobacter mangrovi]MCS0495630.1 ABC transporter permease [Ancylobacter mangrovi]
MSESMSKRLAAIAKPLACFAVLVLIWQYGAPLAGIPSYVLPLPTEIAQRFIETFSVQMQGLAMTAFTTLAGLGLALVVGVLLALLIIYVPLLGSMITPLLAAFNSIPKIAIAPLFVIWFGLGYESKVLLAFLLALFPIFVNSVTGLGEIEADLIDLSTLAGGNRWRIFVKVRLMNAVPYIADAVKVAFPLALVGSIVGEFIGGNSGIGHIILSGQFNLDTPLVFATLLSITLFTTLGIGAVSLFENAFLTWRPSQRRR